MEQWKKHAAIFKDVDLLAKVKSVGAKQFPTQSMEEKKKVALESCTFLCFLGNKYLIRLLL